MISVNGIMLRTDARIPVLTVLLAICLRNAPTHRCKPFLFTRHFAR
jgi:hypothetical protein